MTFSSLRTASTAAVAMWILCHSFPTEATALLEGDVVVRMGQNLPAIKIGFSRGNNNENFITVGSFDLDPDDEGFFRVGGALDCVHYVSSNQAIVSSEVRSTAMHRSFSFFSPGERLLLAIQTNGDALDAVSIISRIELESDCQEAEWSDFTFLTALAGKVRVVN